MTDIIVKNPDTGAKEIRSIFLPVPAFVIGQLISYKEFVQGEEIELESTVIGYKIDVTSIKGEHLVSIDYELADGTIVNEDDVEHFYETVVKT